MPTDKKKRKKKQPKKIRKDSFFSDVVEGVKVVFGANGGSSSPQPKPKKKKIKAKKQPKKKKPSVPKKTKGTMSAIKRRKQILNKIMKEDK